jgi:hypothetical protein
LADGDGGFEDGAYGNEASEVVVRYSGQAHGGDAAAGSAVGIAAELARSDFGLQVGGNCFCGERKNALVGTVRWFAELADD